MPTGYSLNWNGPLIIARLRQAQPAAVDDITTAGRRCGGRKYAG